MNIQQLLSNGKPFKTFYREADPEILYMELPYGYIGRANAQDSSVSEFETDFQFEVNDLVATDWEFV